MIVTRRTLLAAGGSACLAALAGCDVPHLLPGGAAQRSARFGVPDREGIDLAQHVLSRCTFGPAPGDRDRLLALGATQEEAVAAWIARQLRPEAIDDDDAERALRRLDTLDLPVGELFEFKERVLLRELTTATVLRAVHSRRQLHEVMVHFWSDHFNIDISKGECAWLKPADDRDVVRRHALGRFPELLRASALGPAMLWYLDGRVNRRASHEERPNENFARELLELHTLGVRGGYTQRDVMEAARCLTGWTVRPRSGFLKGRVEFHAELHDDGEKQVLGRWFPPGLGERDVDLLIDLVAGHPSTARHLATKLCRRFIADDPPPSAVALVADAFTASGGDIAVSLRALLCCAEFRADAPAAAVRGGKLKRPFDYLASCLRACDADSDAGPALTQYLARMGHAPFQFPTPDGYPETAGSWRGTLLWRWQLADALAGNRVPGTRIDHAQLATRAGGHEALAAHLLGRLPDATEREALSAGDDRLALLLASPTFQRC